MKDLESKIPGKQGCASLDHPESGELNRQVCPSRETSVSKPEEAPYEPMTLISGAGHDALAIAKLTKV